jgi:flagellar basal-body rod protein FlgB
LLIVIERVIMDSFKTLEQLIHMAGMRHGVLTSNIANVDTPNYKAKDLKFQQTLDDELQLKVTASGHIHSNDNNGGAPIEVEKQDAWADGNNVELDMEVAKMTENSMLFQAGVSMLETKIRMFKNSFRR